MAAVVAATTLGTPSITLSAAPAWGMTTQAPPRKVAIVRGRVLDTSGPAEGVQVAIFRNAQTSTCFLGLTDCEDIQLASTVTRAGMFELTVPRPLTAPKGFRISATRPPAPGAVAGPRSRFDLKALADDQTVPDIVLWDRRPVVTEERGLLRAAITPPPGISDRIVTEFAVKDSANRMASYGFTADARQFEDRPIIVSASVGDAQSEVTSFQGTLVPPSRGRPCTPGPTAAPLTPCPMTDGKFSSYTGPRSNDEHFKLRSPIFTVDLGAPMEVGLVVAPGCGRDCAVSASPDGVTWLSLGRDEGPPVSAFAPLKPTVARFVRVEGDVPAEVSVWPPATGRKGQPVVGLLPEDAVRRGFDPARAIVVAASALAALMLFGVLLATIGVAWRRRRR